MNANELADELEDCGRFFEDRLYTKAATMLRQQQAEIEAAMELIKKFQKEREALKDEVAKWKMSYENSIRFEDGYGHN
jgi:DNA polymerase III delta prime subunit